MTQNFQESFPHHTVDQIPGEQAGILKLFSVFKISLWEVHAELQVGLETVLLCSASVQKLSFHLIESIDTFLVF